MEISKPWAFEIVTYTRNGDPYIPKGWVGLTVSLVDVNKDLYKSLGLEVSSNEDKSRGYLRRKKKHAIRKKIRKFVFLSL